MIAYFTALRTVTTKELFLYFTLLTVHTILVTVWYLIALIDIFEGLKVQSEAERRQSATRESSNKLSPMPSEEVKESIEVKLPVSKALRSMQFKEDLYSLLYVSYVRP